MASRRGALLIQRLIKTTKEYAQKNMLKDEHVAEVERQFDQALEGVTNYIAKLEREVRDHR